MFVFTNVFTTGVSHVTFHFFTFQPPRTEMYLTLYYAIMLLLYAVIIKLLRTSSACQIIHDHI